MVKRKVHPAKSSKNLSQNNNGVYEIKVKGHLDDHWKPWFEGMTLTHMANGEPGQECTLITGSISDQPALHGILDKIRDLNLTLISVRKMNSEVAGPQDENTGG